MDANEARKLSLANGKFIELYREVTGEIKKSAMKGEFSALYYLEDWRIDYGDRIVDYLKNKGYNATLETKMKETRIYISWLTDS